jgi:hypothetical protein
MLVRSKQGILKKIKGEENILRTTLNPLLLMQGTLLK